MTLTRVRHHIQLTIVQVADIHTSDENRWVRTGLESRIVEKDFIHTHQVTTITMVLDTARRQTPGRSLPGQQKGRRRRNRHNADISQCGILAETDKIS
jgi:hypothetical protein